MITNCYSSFAWLTALAVLTFAPISCLSQTRSSESTDADGKYNQSTDFKLLKNFGTDARNGLSRHSEFAIGVVTFTATISKRPVGRFAE